MVVFAWTINNAATKRNKVMLGSLLLWGIHKHSESASIVIYINKHEGGKTKTRFIYLTYFLFITIYVEDYFSVY